MKILRKLHLYLGCFFAPLLLLFIATGWQQTVSIQRNKTLGEDAETWFSKLSKIHVDSIYPTAEVAEYNPKLFQWLVVAMSVALIITVLLGVVLAFKYSRNKWLVIATLVLGILLPAVLLWLGQVR